MATISINNLAEAIYESSIDKKADLDAIAKNTVRFLAKRNMLGKSQALLGKLEDIVSKKEGIIRAKITTKNKLKGDQMDEVKKMIRDRYEAKEVQLIETLDPDLLGGIKIEIGDEIIDLSLKNRLTKLENYLKNS
jgi:F-type H+-transporting ATPase subunit delta